MNITTWIVGDLSNLPLLALPPERPVFEPGDLIVMCVTAPLWRVFQLLQSLERAGAGAVAVPISYNQASVVWTCRDDVPFGSYVPLSGDVDVVGASCCSVPCLPRTPALAGAVLTHEKSDSSELSGGKKRRRVAIHTLSQSSPNTLKTLELSINDIGASDNILVLGPMFRGEPTCGKPELYPGRLLNIRVDELFDMSRISELILNELRENNISRDDFAVINLAVVNKYLLKALEFVAVNYFHDFQFVFYDHERNRKQVSEDGIDWRIESIPPGNCIGVFRMAEDNCRKTDVAVTKDSEPSPSSDNDVHETEKKALVPASTPAPAPVPAVKSVSEVDLLLDKKIQSEKILKRKELTECMWERRDLLTTSTSWSVTPNALRATLDSAEETNFESSPQTAANNPETKGTFQDIARALNCPKIIIETKPAAHKIQLIFKGQGNSANMIGSWGYKNKKSYEYDYQLNLKGWDANEVKRYFGGFWFEEFVCCKLDEIKEPKKLGDLGLASNLHTTQNELDVVAFSRDNTKIYVFECKTGKNVSKENVVKLEGIVRKLKQKQKEVLGILVCLQEPRTDLGALKAVRESDCVACVWGSKIPKLLQNAQVLEMAPGEIRGDAGK